VAAENETPRFLQLRPLSPRERLLLVVMFVILYAVGFFFLVYQPYTERIGELRAKLAQEKAKLESARAVLHDLEEIEAKIAELNAELERLNQLVPGDKRVAHFLYYVGQWEKLTGARVHSMQFSQPAAVGKYQEFTVSFTVVGTYTAQVKFLAQLESMNRLVRVDSVSIMPEVPEGEGGTGTPPPDMTAAAYVVHLFVDPGKAAQAAAEEPGAGLVFTLPEGRTSPFRP